MTVAAISSVFNLFVRGLSSRVTGDTSAIRARTHFRVRENRRRRPGFTVHRHPAFFKFGSGGAIKEDDVLLPQFLFDK